MNEEGAQLTHSMPRLRICHVREAERYLPQRQSPEQLYLMKYLRNGVYISEYYQPELPLLCSIRRTIKAG